MQNHYDIICKYKQIDKTSLKMNSKALTCFITVSAFINVKAKRILVIYLKPLVLQCYFVIVLIISKFNEYNN